MLNNTLFVKENKDNVNSESKNDPEKYVCILYSDYILLKDYTEYYIYYTADKFVRNYKGFKIGRWHYDYYNYNNIIYDDYENLISNINRFHMKYPYY